MSANFRNKRVLIAGGTDGIGLEVAHLLASCGAELAIVGRRGVDELILPSGCHYIQADLSTPQALDEILNGLASIGFDNGLDHLVLNASIGYVGPVSDETDEGLLSLLAVNLKAPLALCQGLYGALAIRAGSVCFISSTAAGSATPQFASYTASKTAINHFADNLEIEWQGRVKVQVVSPGPTRTAFHKKAGMDEPPMAGLFMKPQEVARGVVRVLANGKRRKGYSMLALVFFAAKRALFGGVS
ncbi:MAG: SDR family NAD(P)-dependent oxidoreductase [Hyphomicrobiales bacterium]